MEMQRFDSDGVEIAYLDEGRGDPVVLVHGFASTAAVNWTNTGWTEALKRAGRRVVALDNRGHGESAKLYDESAYGAELMAEDVCRLMDHLAISRADVIGYSMGARICAFLAINHPGRVRRAVFAGLGMAMIEGIGDPEPIARALEAPSLEEVSDREGRAFRQFAEQTGSDRRALAACMRGGRRKITGDMVATIQSPVLIAVGETDEIAGSAEGLAAQIPGAEALVIPGRDHMKSVGDKVLKEGAIAFLSRP